MKITSIERINVDLPYLERVVEHLQKGWNFANRATDDEFADDEEKFRQQWRDSSPPSVKTSIYRVHTDEGLVGTGEGRALEDDQLQSYTGRNAFEFIMDDSAGPLQIAFYDLMGQALGLPMAALFGPHQDRVPMAYWSQCFPPEAIQEEARIALEKGYTTHKFKRRAHTDVVEQVASIAAIAPPDYRLTIDANCTFGTAERAVDIGRKLKDYPQVHCLESPIEQANVEGYRTIKRELNYPLAIHYGSPDPVVALHSGVYDYFVMGGNMASLTRNAHVAAAADKPFWMQQAETSGVAVAFMIHQAAAIANATLSHVAVDVLLENTLLKEALTIQEGQVKVPDKPGLGVELDMDSVDRFRIG